MSFKYNLIGDNLGFGNILETILKNRGIDNICEFLNPSEKNIEDINNYDNIEEWISIFTKHIEAKSSIGIVVDSDFDGFSSASLIYQYIKYLNPSISIQYFIHKGKAHGLKDLMNEIAQVQDNIQLLIIPDASSGDFEEHSFIKSWGIDILIADHHEVKGDIYSVDAIVVNNQLSKKVTNKSLTGVGVIYKLCKEIYI
jgi:single-stranded-DNA-specific exonuclease